jgi:hypothetical protein
MMICQSEIPFSSRLGIRRRVKVYVKSQQEKSLLNRVYKSEEEGIEDAEKKKTKKERRKKKEGVSFIDKVEKKSRKNKG